MTVVDIKEPVNAVSIKTKSQPLTITIDPQCEVFRRFYAEEIPPSTPFYWAMKIRLLCIPPAVKRRHSRHTKSLHAFWRGTGDS